MGGFYLAEEEEYIPLSESAQCGAQLEFNVKKDLTATRDKPTESDRQNEQFTQIVAAYKEYYRKKSNSNLTYKKIFFFAILSMLALIILGFVAAGIILAARGAAWKDALPLLGGGTAALLTSLIVLPQIIATHLFPLQEDQVIVDLIAVLRSGNPAERE